MDAGMTAGMAPERIVIGLLALWIAVIVLRRPGQDGFLATAARLAIAGSIAALAFAPLLGALLYAAVLGGAFIVLGAYVVAVLAAEWARWREMRR
jgi:uncharacterized membrane protein YeaQ/YmgE (transglycosylase-associated protein family)